MHYKSKGENDLKACILSSSCSFSRAAHLYLLSNLSTTEFIKSLKRPVSRRGAPNTIYLENAETFKAGAKRLKSINRDEQFHDLLSKEKIIWKFNLSRAPWLGGQYERLIGPTKQSLYKSIRKSLLIWSELKGVLLDVEVNLNNLCLTYIEDV